MINTTTMFRADIFSKNNVGTINQRNDLINELKIKKEITPNGIGFNNIGCWRENYPCENIDWLIIELKDLLSYACKTYSNTDIYFKSFLESSNASIEYWANINLPGSRNNFHNHKTSTFSAVYYIQATSTGNLRFTNPANIMGDCNPSAPFTRDFVIEPTDGDLILWPSWVPHEVETNFSNKERINLAFNIKI